MDYGLGVFGRTEFQKAVFVDGDAANSDCNAVFVFDEEEVVFLKLTFYLHDARIQETCSLLVVAQCCGGALVDNYCCLGESVGVCNPFFDSRTAVARREMCAYKILVTIHKPCNYLRSCAIGNINIYTRIGSLASDTALGQHSAASKIRFGGLYELRNVGAGRYVGDNK